MTNCPLFCKCTPTAEQKQINLKSKKNWETGGDTTDLTHKLCKKSQ